MRPEIRVRLLSIAIPIAIIVPLTFVYVTLISKMLVFATQICDLYLASPEHCSIVSKLCSPVFADDLDTILGKHDNRTLGTIAPAIYVVTAERRINPLFRMEKLRRFLDLDWVYFGALDEQDRFVDQVIHFVEEQRSNVNATLIWPTGVDPLFPAVGDKVWTTETIDGLNDPEYQLLCATRDDTIPANSDDSVTPSKMLPSRGMIAGWYSHLRLLWHIVNKTRHIDEETWDGQQGISIVFEDNIDVEADLSKRLTNILGRLPRDWDLIILGHCWSNKVSAPPFTPCLPPHPSRKPKLTHGYVVSPFGAGRLLTHLSYIPFAFSLDQAIAYLIQTERIRSFSVVPSVVIQRKCSSDKDCKESAQESDMWNEEDRRGKERLPNSALDMLEKELHTGHGRKQLERIAA